MGKKVFHWKYVLLLAVVLLVSSIAIFWDAVALRVAPKAVLTKSITEAYLRLEERFAESPLKLLYQIIDPEGNYTTDMLLRTDNRILGWVTYDLELQTDGVGRRLNVQGTASATQMQLELSGYLDNTFLAVESKELSEGQYYGITFERFAEDIRKIPLLSFFVSETLLDQWDTSLQHIRQQINDGFVLPQIPMLSENDLKALILGILALPCEVETCSIGVEEETLECQTVTYSVCAEGIGQILSQTAYAQDPTVTVTFYLHERHLVKVFIECTAEERNLSCSILFGKNPVEDSIHIQLFQHNGEKQDMCTVTINTESSETQYSENWYLIKTQENVEEETYFQYNYQFQTGDVSLIVDNGEPILFQLIEKDNGISLESSDFQPLMQVFLKENAPKVPVSGTIHVTRGADFETPTYKNLDQWSLEDFWTLLSGVGALAGITIQ